MNRIFIKKHIVPLSIVCFIMMYTILVMMKPSFLYNRDGTFREFGLARSKNTIIPIWLMAIVLACVILCWTLVLYCITENYSIILVIYVIQIHLCIVLSEYIYNLKR